MARGLGSTLWLRWVGANGLAELIGLGGTLALDVAIISRVGAAGSVWASLATILLVTGSGAVEGTVVGLLQWSVLRGPFPAIGRGAWVRATIAGALVAWFVGSLPSTLMDMGAQPGEAPVQEPAAWIVLLLAAGMGLVLGLVLGYPQWRVLQRARQGAWLWLPANAAAWGLGMPTIFATMDLAQRRPSLAGSLLTIALGLVLAGVLVGAVHGLALVRLAADAPGRSLGE